MVVNPAGGGSSAPKLFTVALDDEKPKVIPPDPVSLVQTHCELGTGGTTARVSPLVAAFLAGGTASDSCSSVERLAPMKDGQEITPDTFFGGGPNVVTFRYRDASGRIGEAVSTVTVELYGDLDQNYVVEATDLLIMANSIVRNVNVGQPPFTAPAFLADVNDDGRIDAVDMTVLSHYLVGNITCLPYIRP